MKKKLRAELDAIKLEIKELKEKPITSFVNLTGGPVTLMPGDVLVIPGDRYDKVHIEVGK